MRTLQRTTDDIALATTPLPSPSTGSRIRMNFSPTEDLTKFVMKTRYPVSHPIARQDPSVNRSATVYSVFASGTISNRYPHGTIHNFKRGGIQSRAVRFRRSLGNRCDVILVLAWECQMGRAPVLSRTISSLQDDPATSQNKDTQNPILEFCITKNFSG